MLLGLRRGRSYPEPLTLFYPALKVQTSKYMFAMQQCINAVNMSKANVKH
jgi:hypothetical protein